MVAMQACKYEVNLRKVHTGVATLNLQDCSGYTQGGSQSGSHGEEEVKINEYVQLTAWYKTARPPEEGTRTNRISR